MPEKRKISKEKGVSICADMLSAGQSRKEIILFISEKCKVSDKTVDNWIKAARPAVQERQREAEAVRAKVTLEETEASAKRLNLSKERLMEELAKVAYGDVRKILTVDGGLKEIPDWDDDTAGAVAGIESVDEKTRTGEVLGTVRKVKTWDKIRAIEALNKMLGYNAPEKKELTGTLDLTAVPIIFK